MKRSRSGTQPQRYDRTGLLAVDPKAFFDLFIVPATRGNELVGDTCVVEIEGPLETRDDGWCDSYEAIRNRVTEACQSEAKHIVLRVDSPGGACKGCFDTVRAIRAMCEAAGKPLYAYCDHATSAGYAIATAASFLMMPDIGLVGSIGVLERRPDYSAQNAQAGVRIELITSGARKGDGNPDKPISDDELAAKQEIVNATARVFYALVEDTRGIDAAEVAAMQAGVFHAEAARAARLVDDVGSFESFLARIAGGKVEAMSAYEKARSALEEAAKGDDANAAAAQRALAAMKESGDGGGDDDKDKDDESESSESSENAAAQGDDDDTEATAAEEPSDDDKKKKPSEQGASARAASSNTGDAHSVALEALAKAHELEATLASRDAKAERKRLLSKRPDFSKELRAELMRDTTPIDTVRRMVKTLKRGPVSTAAAAAAATPAATRGDGQGSAAASGSTPSTTADGADMDMRMGIVQTTLGTYRERNALCFGVVPAKPAVAAAPSGGKEAAK